jgi:hypothetical protein
MVKSARLGGVRDLGVDHVIPLGTFLSLVLTLRRPTFPPGTAAGNRLEPEKGPASVESASLSRGDVERE